MPIGPSGRSSGNRMTSRIDFVPVMIIDQPVDADPFTAGRRHAVAQCAQVVLVHPMRFFVARSAIPSCISNRRRCSCGSFNSV